MSLNGFMGKVTKSAPSDRAREGRFRQLFDSAADAIFLLSVDGRVLEANREACDRLGYSCDDLRGLTPRDFIPADSARGLPERLQRIRKDGRAVFESAHICRDGTVMPVEINASVIEFEGQPALLSIARDITERKRAENELRHSEQRLRTVIDHAPLVLWALDEKGIFTFSEGRGLAALGMEPGQLVGLSLFDVYADHASIVADGRRVLSGESFHSQAVVDGTSFDVHYRPILDDAGKVAGAIGVATDVTEQIHLEARLRQSQKMEAVGQLAGGVAHDFNNILQAIRGYTEIVLEYMDPSSPEHGYLQVVRQASNRAVTLIRQMLAFSRTQRLNEERLVLDEVIHGLTKMLQRLIGEHIDLEVRTSGVETCIEADPGQIEQVLMNLCVNSRDAMRGGGRLTVSSRPVRLDEEFVERKPWARIGDFVQLTVSDTGEGIAEEIRDRIFEPFFTTKDVGEGTGLGLATVYAIVKRHDGMIDVESEVGLGTTFRLYFPRVESATASAPEPAIPARPPGGTETILLAEDEELVRGWTVEVLEAAGYSVIAARDGEEAIELFGEDPDRIDLALLDVVMPKRSGRAVHGAIHARRPDVPVLFTSGYSYRLLESEQLPADEPKLLQKPYRAEDLLKRLRELLDPSA